MPIPKRYIHDKLVLLLLSVTVFLVLLCSILVFLRLDGGSSDGYITQYRANLGISAFKNGGVTDLLGFVLFVVIIAVGNWLLSMKVYPIKKAFALAILSLGIFLIIMTIIVSNALLVLR